MTNKKILSKHTSNQFNTNILTKFLKGNEILFTVIGIFLVLAITLNSPQITDIIFPQNTASQSYVIQVNCSNTISSENLQNHSTYSNCSGTAKVENVNGINSNFNPIFKGISFNCFLIVIFLSLLLTINAFKYLNQYFKCIKSNLMLIDSIKLYLKYFSILLFIVPFLTIVGLIGYYLIISYGDSFSYLLGILVLLLFFFEIFVGSQMLKAFNEYLGEKEVFHKKTWLIFLASIFGILASILIVFFVNLCVSANSLVESFNCVYIIFPIVILLISEFFILCLSKNEGNL